MVNNTLPKRSGLSCISMVDVVSVTDTRICLTICSIICTDWFDIGASCTSRAPCRSNCCANGTASTDASVCGWLVCTKLSVDEAFDSPDIVFDESDEDVWPSIAGSCVLTAFCNTSPSDTGACSGFTAVNSCKIPCKSASSSDTGSICAKISDTPSGICANCCRIIW